MSIHIPAEADGNLDNFDTGPLSWVMGEIREALHRSKTALIDAIEKDSESSETLINHASTYLHQAHGALQIVDVSGVSLITESVEEVLHGMAEKQIPVSLENAKLIENIYQALVEYLEDLLGGSPQRPISLFPFYRELKELLGVRRIHPADLFFPDLANKKDLIPDVSGHSPSENSSFDYAELRPRFEKLLLPVLKNSPTLAGSEEAKAMMELVAGVEKAQDNVKLRDFWRVMLAFAETVYNGMFSNELHVKYVFARINLQIRHLAEQSNLLSERLIREALFLIGCAEDATPLMQDIRNAYQIDGLIPADYETKKYGLLDLDALDTAKQVLADAKQAWVRVTGGEDGANVEFAGKTRELAEASAKLKQPSLALVFHTVSALAQNGIPAESKDVLALEMASLLLFAENALEQIRQLPADFGQKSEVFASRLIAIQSGKPLDSEESIAGAAPEKQQQRTVMQLAAEMESSLRQVERILDEYFVDISQFELLSEADPILHQIEGGLQLVEQEDARQAVLHVQKVLKELYAIGADSERVNQETLQDIAHNVSALGFFLEMLAQHPESARNRFSFDYAAGLFRTRFIDTPDERNAVFMYSETDSAQGQLDEILGGAANVLKKSKSITDNTVSERQETTVPEQVASSTQDAKPQDASPDSSEDDELLEIFILEAEEALDYVKDTVSQIRGMPEDQEQFPTIRRSFHTLKGSSRMVGLTAFSEASASVEQVMNLWLSEARGGTPALYGLLEKAAEELGKWVADLKTSGKSPRTSEALAAAADRVKKGGDFYLEESSTDSEEDTQPETLDSQAGQQQEEPTVETVIEADKDAESEDVASSAEIRLDFDTAPVESAELLMDSNVVDFPAVKSEPVKDDDFRQIGDLQVSLPLFTIYLSEANELVRYLSQEFAAWTNEPDRAVPDKAIHSAHSLSGCSATVGLHPMQEVAHALEMFLQGLDNRRQTVTVEEFAVLQECIESLEQMLSQVVLYEMPQSPTELLMRMQEMQPGPSKYEEVEQVQAKLEDAPTENAPAENAPHFIENEDVLESGEDVQESAPEAQADAEPAQALGPKDSLDPDLLPIFLEEGRDLLPQVGQALRAWQKAPSDFSYAPVIQRLLHTAKGSARMAGAMGLGQHIHLMESRIENLLRTKAVSPQVLDDMMARYDHGMQLFSLLEEDPGESPVSAPTVQAQDAPENAVSSEEPGKVVNSLPSAAASTQRVRVRADILDRLVNQAGEVSIARSKIENEIDNLRQSMFDLTDNLTRLRQQLREVEIQAETQIASRLAQTSDREFDPLEFDRFSRLQELTRMMTESVDDISSIQEGLIRTVDNTSLDLQNQNRLTRVLQEDLMQVRMVPFASIAERLYQVTRQTSKETDKRVNLDIKGASVEVDRSVLDRMMGPLEHLLRNAVVHGVESREARKASSKDETGELLVEIRQEGNEIILELSDDGQGLNLDRIREKAESAGLLKPDQQVSEAQLKEMVFQPGFSTASEITQLAGRGVGLDVVRAEVAGLGGRVSISSDAGKGTRFTVILPLTLAVTSVVLLSTGGKTFAVPSTLVEQVQHFKSDALTSAYRAGSISWRNEPISLHFLSALLGEANDVPVIQQYTPVVILRSGNDRVAVHVDQILGNKEVVVKNVGAQLARMPGIAGATVLGSGEIVLILNPIPLAHRVASIVKDAPREDAAAAPDPISKAIAITDAEKKEDAVSGRGADGVSAEGVRRKNIVMVVDDSLTVRRVTQRFLTREGYQVVLAKDGIDALEQLQNITPDVMLVDIEMPRMDGFDLTRNVRGDSKWRSIPIIMITSRSASKHRNYAMDLGVNEYFGKPFQEEELLKSINSFVGREKASV